MNNCATHDILLIVASFVGACIGAYIGTFLGNHRGNREKENFVEGTMREHNQDSKIEDDEADKP